MPLRISQLKDCVENGINTLDTPQVLVGVDRLLQDSGVSAARARGLFKIGATFGP
jgi:hypothetical protein